MLDWEGNMVGKKDRMKSLLSEIEEDANKSRSLIVSSLESVLEDSKVLNVIEDDDHPHYQIIPKDADQVADQSSHQLLEERGETGHMSCAIGATTVPHCDCVC